MATYKFFDTADEFRIQIVGRFAGGGVEEVKRSWEEALRQPSLRRVSVDISRLSGYDTAGRKLLADMYRHGTELSARNASALVFMNEIANIARTPAALMTTSPKPQKRPLELPLWAKAAGE